MAKNRNSWTITHDIGLVYLALAHGTDTELSDSEIKVMVEEMKRWEPSLSDLEVKELILESMAVYLSDDRDEELRRAFLAIREDSTANKKLAVLNDLVELAEADGIVLYTERELVKTMAKIWNVEVAKNTQLQEFLD